MNVLDLRLRHHACTFQRTFDGVDFKTLGQQERQQLSPFQVGDVIHFQNILSPGEKSAAGFEPEALKKGGSLADATFYPTGTRTELLDTPPLVITTAWLPALRPEGI
jgi:hypothetical protein